MPLPIVAGVFLFFNRRSVGQRATVNMILLNLLLAISLAFSTPFSDGAVLQSGKPIPVSGSAAPGARVKLSFNGVNYRCKADSEGKWRVVMRPSGVCSKPGAIIAKSGRNVAVVNDVLVGEVWIASGQSNMQMMVKALAQADIDSLKTLSDKMLRVFRITPVVMGGKLLDRPEPVWEQLGRDDIASWSAVATYFALELRKRFPDTPVGIALCAQGGATAEAFFSQDYVEANPDIKDSFFGEVSGIGMNYQNPCSLFEPMIRPVAGYPVRGIIWYQGETNASRPDGYRVVFPALIDNYRQIWSDPLLPFIFAEISTYPRKDEAGLAKWKELQKIQAETASSVPGTGIALTDDIGDPTDIHPKNKKPVGERLAAQAFEIAYQYGPKE